MTQMNRKKGFVSAGALFMGLVVILGVLGIVNGLWSKNLIVDGTVQTGDLNADWDCAYTNDDGINFEPPTTGPCSGVAAETGDDGRDPFGSFDFPYSSPFVEKDVGECEVIIDPDTDEPDFGAQVAQVTVTNGYPSYECSITLYLSNTGSIPFNVVGSVLSLDEEDPIELLEECELDAEQVDPGGEQALTCTIHILQEAEQNDCTGTTTTGVVTTPVPTTFPVVSEDCTILGGSYEFSIEVCVAQWNEEATFEQCKDSVQHEGPGGAGDADGIVGAADLCPTEPEDGIDDPNYDDAVLPNPDDGCPVEPTPTPAP